MGVAVRDVFRLGLPDSKRINRLLFGAHYEEDICDLASARLPRMMGLLSGRIPAAMRARNVVFVHVPRAAGTSIASALYGPGATKHYSARYFRALDGKFFAQADSFAVLRDPVDRFASAFAFVRTGGTSSCRLSTVFAAATAAVRTVDDYLSFLEGRGALDLDFVMRPQSWFVCDSRTGAPLVRDLFLLGEVRLADYLRRFGVTRLPHLNASERLSLLLSARQKSRIERLYAQDFAMVEVLKRQRAHDTEDRARVTALAAE